MAHVELLLVMVVIGILVGLALRRMCTISIAPGGGLGVTTESGPTCT